MAKVSLRIYNREIESLIDKGAVNEAIAHCHHTLRTFPKHLATYRLLGKACLEQKRYSDAVDIFSRVLMAVPDDYVSHVGMSIICDEERKMDEAIWHMERAFETQSSNAAIQGELQRLYGRRDGMEPPKIRMTRGALAHLYVQGELYPQAIAEIRAVLSQESDRADMQVLLARAYFRGGQKADASEMCAQLLKQYLYCFDANRIMVDLLPSTAGAAESTQVYRMRVGEMDPYATFAKGSVFLSHEVADAAISVERLEYKGGEESEAQQTWRPSLGLGAAAAAVPAISAATSTNEPDWLKSSGVSQTPPQPVSSGPQDEIPDFLRQAGWGTSSGPEQPVSMFDEETSGDTLTPAEIPDWLKGQEPVNTASTPESIPTPAMETPDWLLDNPQTFPPAQEVDVPDWLKGVSQPSAESAQMDNTAGWLNGLDGGTPFSEEPAQAGNIPDWLGGSDNQPSPAVEPENLPDWLSGTGGQQQAEPADIPDWLSGKESTPAAEPTDIPGWLSEAGSQSQVPAESTTPSVESLGSTAQEQDDAVAWLESLAAKHGAKPEELVTDPNKRNEKPPEWVAQAQSVNQEPPATSIESLGSTAEEQDDAVAWLESLAAKHGAKPEELVTDPNKRNEKPPEWVAQAQSLNQEPPATSIESLGSTAQEQDDAVAWLESLAAKHGAKPEELVTDPNKRSETPPEWVAQAQSLGESQTPVETGQKPEIVENALNIGEQFFAEFENASATPAGDATSAWLQDLAREEDEKQPQEFGVSNEIPDWLSDSKADQETGDQFESMHEETGTPRPSLPGWLSEAEQDSEDEVVSTGQVMPETDLANWLNSLDDEPGLPFDSIPTPDSILFESQSRPAAKSKGGGPIENKLEIPDWLSGVDEQNLAADHEWKGPAPEQSEEFPEWLQENQETGETEAFHSGDDTPPWLHREKWEAGEPQHPQPTSPSDWHPLEPRDLSQPEIAAPVQKQQVPEVHKPFVPPPPQPVSVQSVAAAPIPQSEAPAKKKSGLPARKQLPEGANATAALNQAKNELDRGDIPAALTHYGKLIKKGKHIEETIRDLTESIYRYPVEVGIWQTLGDAYMRANRLKEALEAYNKAEELIR